MKDFSDFKAFAKEQQPEAKITGDAEEYLQSIYQELTDFLNSLVPEHEVKSVPFKEIFMDQIFEFQGAKFVKIEEGKAQEFQGREIQEFSKNTIVDFKLSPKTKQ